MSSRDIAWAIILLLAVIIVGKSSSTCPQPCYCYPLYWNRSLTDVSCRWRWLTYVPGPFPANTGRLRVTSNEFQYLPPGVFNNLTYLEVLDLSRNQLLVLRPEVFYNLTYLEDLDLSRNQLTELSAGVFSRNNLLEELDLSDNQLSELSTEVFSRNNLLQKL
ncbi:platelet glycoprotein IX-like [Oculina patagonica]